MPGPDDIDGGLASGGEDLGAGGGEGAAGSEGGAGESIDDTLLSTFREISARDEEGEGAEAAAAAAATAQQNRDKVGRFAQGTKPGATAGQQPGAPAAGQQPPANGQQAPTGQQGQQQQGTGKPHDTLPNTWNRGLAGVWGQLPENVRQEIYKREDDARKGIAQYKSSATAFQTMASELIQPHVEDFKAVGMDPRTALRDVVGTWSSLVRGSPAQRVGIIRQLCDGFGINPVDLGAPRDGGGTQQGQGDSPALTNALQRIAQLEGTLRGYEEQRQSEAQEQQQAEAAQLSDEWNRFRADPANEFVDQLAPTMQRLLVSGEATGYRDAYDKAALLVADVRTALDARKATSEANDEAARAAAARKAGNVNTQRRGLPAPAQGAPSVVDTARSTYREIMARNGA